MKEFWMGTHPNGPSEVDLGDKTILLSDWLKEHPEAMGNVSVDKNGFLPFLFKVLSIEKGLEKISLNMSFVNPSTSR